MSWAVIHEQQGGRMRRRHARRDGRTRIARETAAERERLEKEIETIDVQAGSIAWGLWVRREVERLGIEL